MTLLVPGQRLDQVYRERLIQIERLDAAGFYAYHLAEHLHARTEAHLSGPLGHAPQEDVLRRGQAMDRRRVVQLDVVEDAESQSHTPSRRT